MSFRDELLAAEQSESGFTFALALTREPPTRTSDFARRIDEAIVADVAGRLSAPPGYVFVCGSNAFCDVAADGALAAGLGSASIKTERYGAWRGEQPSTLETEQWHLTTGSASIWNDGSRKSVYV